MERGDTANSVGQRKLLAQVKMNLKKNIYMLLLKLPLFWLSDSIMIVLSTAMLLIFLDFTDIGALLMLIRYCNMFCIIIPLKVADVLILWVWMVTVLWNRVTASCNLAHGQTLSCMMCLLVQAGQGEGGSKAAERKATEKWPNVSVRIAEKGGSCGLLYESSTRYRGARS